MTKCNNWEIVSLKRLYDERLNEVNSTKRRATMKSMTLTKQEQATLYQFVAIKLRASVSSRIPLADIFFMTRYIEFMSNNKGSA